tara:strand:+ start:1598 stop:2125 length:528 start_codon:yes stop_codon:yes gene_type:complete
MEKRINKKIDLWRTKFKNDILQHIKASHTKLNPTNIRNLEAFIMNYQSCIIDKTDLVKRKRIKNQVPLCDKCCALRANGEQCSRRRKDKSKFCGTHIKGIPHGEITDEPPKKTHKEISIWTQEIHGIDYYIDGYNNIYDYNDIINNAETPRIVAHYAKTDNGYSIPELFEATSGK